MTMQIFIFSDKYLNALADLLPDAQTHTIGRIKHLAADNNITTTTKLAAAMADVIGKPSAAQAIQANLQDFLSQNNHIHFDAFINICLEETA